MRMWMIPPEFMCMQHIVGEHGEIHKHRHNFVKHHSISGRISPVVQIEPMSMKQRHDELALFMKHRSPYDQPDTSYLNDNERYVKVDISESIKELNLRCQACREKLKKLTKIKGKIIGFCMDEILVEGNKSCMKA